MTKIIRLEEGILFLGSLMALLYLNAAWWLYLLLIIGPDISMLGYIIGNKAGAISYNVFHHKGVAVLVYLIGFFTGLFWLQMAGIILFGHSCMDRMFGFGLKYYKGFGYTHLGTIGNNK